jgi:hypothetical protein
MDERLTQLASRSHDEDTLIVEFVYHGRYCQFDVPAQEMKYLPMDEIIGRYFAKGFAAVQMPCAEEIGETHASALSSSSETNVG